MLARNPRAITPNAGEGKQVSPWNALRNRGKSLLLNFKNKIDLHHELDYSKHKLYMCDNVRLSSCSKEPDTMRWIETFSKEDVFFDIGANAGAYSLLASLYAKQVYAFEPAVTNFSLLSKNIILNVQKKRIENNVCPFNIALSDKTQKETLKYINVNTGKSGHQIKDTIDGFGQNFVPQYSHLMICYALDDFIETFEIPKPNHMKIDVDGIEWEILQGARKTLDSSSLKSIMVEIDIHSPKAKLITDLLAQKSFQLHDKYLLVPGTGMHNHLFKRK
jgi:FkbM family methyltransferase